MVADNFPKMSTRQFFLLFYTYIQRPLDNQEQLHGKCFYVNIFVTHRYVLRELLEINVQMLNTYSDSPQHQLTKFYS